MTTHLSIFSLLMIRIMFNLLILFYNNNNTLYTFMRPSVDWIYVKVFIDS